MREFYIYGFKSRSEYTYKSARSYDNERRRVESWLDGYMGFHNTSDGKNVFISVDSRACPHNPLYNAFKAKSFTDGDITLHFVLFDILYSPDIGMTVGEITEAVDFCLSQSENFRAFDESTVRKKLNEYAAQGIINREKRGKFVYYSRAVDLSKIEQNALDFFSETLPCGVIGSFLLDKIEPRADSVFAFKHHYITSAPDSEIICSLLDAIADKQYIELESARKRSSSPFKITVVPLRIMKSSQNGREYLMAYVPVRRHITSFRIDYILSVRNLGECEYYSFCRALLEDMTPHIWGVSTQSSEHGTLGHVEFTVCYNDNETHIPARLEREKRCGTVERLDANHSRFSADIYDLNEILPWIKTFICRITDISFSDPEIERHFKSDIDKLYELYGV